ncbi:unnamed protein product [[Candida] boidinii]|uniref:Unnamed protein product n=1 Tax=Candida boidinii TaxID=5477 RepID=A0A9W6SZ39_CANBO|nr:unnamed protein product [[Candida] boidinii]
MSSEIAALLTSEQKPKKVSPKTQMSRIASTSKDSKWVSPFRSSGSSSPVSSRQGTATYPKNVTPKTKETPITSTEEPAKPKEEAEEVAAKSEEEIAAEPKETAAEPEETAAEPAEPEETAAEPEETEEPEEEPLGDELVPVDNEPDVDNGPEEVEISEIVPADGTVDEDEEEEIEEEPVAKEATDTTEIDETETPIEEETEAPIKAEAETSDEKPAEEAPEDVPEKAPVKGSEKVIAVDLNPPVKDSIEQELEDKPKMLSRYQENKLYANQALNNVQVANPNKVINLGAGLVLTEAQIFALAAQRVAPVLKSVEDHANVLRKNDEDKAKAIYNAFVTKDQGKLNKDLAKFKSGVDAENKKIVDSYDIRIGAHNKTMAENAAACEAYIASVATQMETDKDEAAKAEEKSAADHITNKENLATKLLTYKEDKEQELVDTKAKQEEEKKLAEEFKISGDDFKEKADALEIQLAEKEKELSEKLAYLDSLISEKGEHND